MDLSEIDIKFIVYEKVIKNIIRKAVFENNN
jgi:hypothetical protein